MKLGYILIGAVTASETCYGPVRIWNEEILSISDKIKLDPDCKEINCFEEYDWASVNCIKTCNFCALSNPDSQEDAPILLGAPSSSPNELIKKVQDLIVNIRPPLNNRKKLNLSRRVKVRVELKFNRFSSFMESQIEQDHCDSMPNLQEKSFTLLKFSILT